MDGVLPLIVLVGPTAVGKTSATLMLARALGAEIVNGDSVQLYRGLDVGTAKPTLGDRRAIPHHLLDVADPDQPVTAAVYRALAAGVFWELQRRRQPAILTGGSPLYIDVATGRRQVSGVPPDEGWRQQASGLTNTELFARLTELDPVRAAAVDRHNHRRLVRAIEIARGGAAPAQPSVGPRLHLLKIGLTRPAADLRVRIDIRAAALFSGGIVRETKELWDRGFGPHLRPMQSLGYREATWFLQGRATLEEAAAALGKATHRFAKRQMTWWRRDQEIAWIDADDKDTLLERALSFFESVGYEPRC